LGGWKGPGRTVFLPPGTSTLPVVSDRRSTSLRGLLDSATNSNTSRHCCPSRRSCDPCLAHQLGWFVVSVVYLETLGRAYALNTARGALFKVKCPSPFFVSSKNSDSNLTRVAHQRALHVTPIPYAFIYSSLPCGLPRCSVLLHLALVRISQPILLLLYVRCSTRAQLSPVLILRISR